MHLFFIILNSLCIFTPRIKRFTKVEKACHKGGKGLSHRWKAFVTLVESLCHKGDKLNFYETITKTSELAHN